LGERQVALSKYSCLRERMCWVIVFEITLCVFIENIVFPLKGEEWFVSLRRYLNVYVVWS
jgi:hypothetical protein